MRTVSLMLTASVLALSAVASAQESEEQAARGEDAPIVQPNDTTEAPPVEPPPPDEFSDADLDGEVHPRDLADPHAPEAAEPPEIAEAPALSASVEVGIGLSPSIGFGLGGLAGTGGLGRLAGGVGGRTDFAFAVDQRLFLGLGLQLVHAESADLMGSSTLVEVPLVAQIYFDTPRRGLAVPTLRITPAIRWGSARDWFAAGTYEWLGGRLTFGVGVTWFATDWLGVRLLGDIGASADIAYTGPEEINVQVYVGANLGVVIRL